MTENPASGVTDRMTYKELIVLLPCHSLEDFPTHHEGDDAESLLAAWTALWHPTLLAAAGVAPTWYRVDDPPEELAERLIVIPSVSQSELPTGFAQRAKAAGAQLIRRENDRERIIQKALDGLDGGNHPVDPELVADFLALGYCHLQVELLTRQMRYSSNLDEVHFHNEVLAGAAAAVNGNQDLAREKITACFDLLAEERDHYYSVDAFVVDLVPLAASTLGASLRDELQSPTPLNVLLSGDLLQRLAAEEPETLECIRQAADAGRLSVIGGDAVEQRVPLLAAETVLANLRRGREIYREILGTPPKIYGRRRFGLAPLLPQLLAKLGYQGALHATLDDGRFPEGGQVKVRWEGSGGTAVDAVARTPANANLPETFLGYSSKLGESMDMDHVATLLMAHWPGQSRLWLGDMRRAAAYTPALGRFITLDQYFADTDLAGQLDRFDSDQYRSPFLKQAVIRREADPISTSVRYWQRRVAVDCLAGLDTLNRLLNGKGQDVAEITRTVDATCDDAETGDLQERIDDALESAVSEFSGRLSRTSTETTPGYLICNPLSFVRRIGLQTPALKTLPDVERPVYAVGETDTSHAVVDVPPMGFVWLQGGSGATGKRSRKDEQPLAEEGLLRNEFFEVLVNPHSGAIQSVHEYSTRGNRLSQQLAFRSPDEAGRGASGASYSVMAADSVKVTASSPAFGEIESRGRLLNREGKELAGFVQRLQLWRGSRVLNVEIELDPRAEPKADPWNSYYACRFAWSDEAAELWRAVNQGRHTVSANRFEAPNYLEIDDSRGRTTLLTGGLPFHRRQGRMLDTLLITRGETARKFRLGIGIEIPHPMQEALGFLAPPAVAQQTAAAPQPASSGWMFHLDAKNVLATAWEPLWDDDKIVGFRTRLLETAGRAARCKLRCLRPVASARQLNFQGESLGDVRVEGDTVQLELTPGEWLELEARWA